MKKVALLALLLLVSLPSCRKDKSDQQVRQDSEQRVDMFSDSSNMGMYDYEYEDEDLEEGDDLRTLFDFDEEVEEFVAQNDAYGDDYDMGEEQAITWVDAQEDELKPLFFEFNKHVLNENQKQALAYDIDQVKQLVAEAGEGNGAMVVVEGHTCQEGSPEYNIALSERRADSIAKELVEAGIDKDIIKVVGRGPENPLVEGKNRSERAPNRRGEVRVIYT